MFVMEMHCVFSEVGNESLNSIYTSFDFRWSYNVIIM
jgi:hypothetical protein